MFFKLGVLKSFANFKGNQLCWGLFKKQGMELQEKEEHKG